jgi:hypothetical protein
MILSRWVTRFSLGRGLFPLVLIPALHGRPFPVGLRPLSPCLHNVSALPVICFPEPLFALSHIFHTCTTSHSTAPTGCSLPFAPHWSYRCASDSVATSLSQCSAVTARHGFFLWPFKHDIGGATRPALHAYGQCPIGYGLCRFAYSSVRSC